MEPEHHQLFVNVAIAKFKGVALHAVGLEAESATEPARRRVARGDGALALLQARQGTSARNRLGQQAGPR